MKIGFFFLRISSWRDNEKKKKEKLFPHFVSPTSKDKFFKRDITPEGEKKKVSICKEDLN